MKSDIGEFYEKIEEFQFSFETETFNDNFAWRFTCVSARISLIFIRIHRKIICSLVFKNGMDSTGSKNVQWRGFVNTLMNLLSIYLSLYSPLLDLGRFFNSLILYTVGRIPWTGNQSVARPLPTHRHPCLEWDSNPRSQSSSRRRDFIP
jgi:hypothetical protein